jgi:multidrug efflux pump subunit AcrA (membrane-fusion protein)
MKLFPQKRIAMRTLEPGIKKVPPAAVAAILMLALGACSQPVAESTPAQAEAPSDPNLIRLSAEAIRVANIALGDVETREIEQELQVSGRVMVNENATARVGSFTEGVVIECCESVGSDVRKGQVLARLHSHEIHEAEASYWQARAELERRQAELQYAGEFHMRASRLHELKAGSLQQVQEAESKRRSAESFLEMAKAGLERAVNHLRYLGLTPEQLPGAASEHAVEGQNTHEEVHLIEVLSPVSGTILDRTVSQGAVVTPSESLYVISDLSRLWVIAQVPEQHLSLLRKGLAVDVSVRAYPGKVFPARITNIGDSLDPETRTVEVRCELSNPGRQLKTEMFATLKIRGAGSSQATVTPISALQHVDDEEIMFVQEGENAFRARRVQTGRHSDSVVEIVSGLQPGEKVVITGAFHLKSELLKGQMIEE